MKYGFIGCGNMGGALAGAAAKAVPADEILVSDRDGAKTAAFSAETGASVGSAAQVAEKCGYIFLGSEAADACGYVFGDKAGA